MAERLGISKPFYCQIENGSRRLSYDMAVRIAEIFGKNFDLYQEMGKSQINCFIMII